MPTFSERSLTVLATCDERLRMIANETIKIMDFAVIVGHRGELEQNMAWAQGKSKLKFPDSLHNKMPSLAMDVAPWPIDWSSGKALERFVYLQGIIRAIAERYGIPIRQGIDWDMDNDMRDETFRDYPHVELRED